MAGVGFSSVAACKQKSFGHYGHDEILIESRGFDRVFVLDRKRGKERERDKNIPTREKVSERYTGERERCSERKSETDRKRDKKTERNKIDISKKLYPQPERK